MKKWLSVLSIMLLAAIVITGCGGPKAKTGDLVKVHYTGTLTDGTEFDSSAGRGPLEFTIGAGEVIEGFENAVIGMKVGEKKTVTIPADQAYLYDENLVFEVELAFLPDGVAVGQQLYMTQPDGSVFPIRVTAINEATATIDANSIVAGKDLTFEIELVEIVATE